MTYETSYFTERRSTMEREYLEECGDSDWAVNNSSIDDYSYDAGIYSHYPGGLGQLIVDQIGTKDTNVALDLAGGSNGRALCWLLDQGIVGKALLTNYEDQRDEEIQSRCDLGHVSGNLMDEETWDAIAEWVRENAPGGLNLIMHRPYGGLQWSSPEFYEHRAHFLMDLLADGGLLFCQIPRILMDGLNSFSPELKAICAGIRIRRDIEKVEVPKNRNSRDLAALIFKTHAAVERI